jgi:hypothetical protein
MNTKVETQRKQLDSGAPATCALRTGFVGMLDIASEPLRTGGDLDHVFPELL